MVMTVPNGRPPGWVGAASVASRGGRGMVRQKARPACKCRPRFKITPPPIFSFRGGRLDLIVPLFLMGLT